MRCRVRLVAEGSDASVQLVDAIPNLGLAGVGATEAVAEDQQARQCLPEAVLSADGFG